MPASALVLNWASPDLTARPTDTLLIYATKPLSKGRTHNRQRDLKLTAILPCSGLASGFSVDFTAAWESRFGQSIITATGAQIFVAARLMSSSGIAGPFAQNSASFLDQPVNPASVSGLFARWQADVPATLWQDSGKTTHAVANNDPVGAWDDSIAGLSILQATAGKRPLLKTAGINTTHPTVKFDGVDDFLRVIDGTVHAQPLTAYLVCLPQTPNAAQHRYWDSTNGLSDIARMNVGAANSFGINAGTGLNNGPATTAAVIYTAVFNGTKSKIYINGNNLGTGDAGSVGLQMLTLGASQSTAPNFFCDAGYAEIDLFAGVHDNTLVSGIYSWLATHWGF